MALPWGAWCSAGPGSWRTGDRGARAGRAGGLSVQRQLDGKSVPCWPHPPVLGSKIFGVDYQGTLGALLKLFTALKNKIELTSCGFKWTLVESGGVADEKAMRLIGSERDRTSEGGDLYFLNVAFRPQTPITLWTSSLETSGPRLQKYYLNSIETLPGGGGGTSNFYLGCLHLAQNSQTYIVVSRNIIEILSFLSQHKKTFFESQTAETHDENKWMTKKLKPVNKSGFVERGCEGRARKAGSWKL